MKALTPPPTLTLALDAELSPDTDVAIGDVLGAMAALFERHPEAREIKLELGAPTAFAERARRIGLIHDIELGEGHLRGVCKRSTLLQLPGPWLPGRASAGYPLLYTMSQGRRHPERPPIALGTVYRRTVPAADTVVSFRTVAVPDDLDAIHRWMNDPRVAAFWELAGTRREHADYLERTLADRHVHPLVGCFDGHPFGYFEAYWAKEDRIAPFYDVDDYDRGIHMLVGEPRFRGPHRVAAWLPSLVHYLFLDDPRTRKVVAEPRADNAKMIGYLAQTGFFQAKEFDFPHKRAAMMIVSREVFFGEHCP
jgi:RimJ/RimL family protein N-acetyltransferase